MSLSLSPSLSCGSNPKQINSTCGEKKKGGNERMEGSGDGGYLYLYIPTIRLRGVCVCV